MYSYEEVLKASEEYFGNELSAKAFVDKYALRNNNGDLLEKTPDDMHKRIAKELARIENKKFKKPLSEDEIFSYLEGFEQIIPQGSPMYGIGNKYQYVSISNCFVLDLYDSYGSICKTDQEIAHISKRRGGVGWDISNLRPSDMRVQNAAHTTTGAVSFMHRFSNTLREVGQHGRRGAGMCSISVHHPDILQFATIKNDNKSVTGCNISVRLSDEFLKALEKDEEYELRWPIDASIPEVSRMISAKEVWNTIIHSAWLRAEPGLLFWDNIIKESPADCYSDVGFKTISTNPCGELPLCDCDSCRLLIMNLLACVVDAFKKTAKFDFDKLYELAQVAQRFMDNMIDLEIESIGQILQKIDADPESDDIKYTEMKLWRRIMTKAHNGRRTGTGITALGDVFAALGIKYGSPKSIELTDEIYKTLKLGCYRASVDIAKELGPFPIWDKDKEKDNPFLLRIKDEDPKLYTDMQRHGRRNIGLLTTAPTGTTSMVARLAPKKHGTTSGIEPLWSTEEITRRKKGNPGDEDFRSDFVDQSGDHWMEFKVRHPGIDLLIYHILGLMI
jgi:ribonucleoside-diphosphate reductase alpha chain